SRQPRALVRRHAPAATGTVNEKVLPTSTSLSRSIVPPCASTIPLASESPSPIPVLPAFACQNGSKMLLRSATGIPGPVSATEKRTEPSVACAPTVILSSGGVNLIALPIRWDRRRALRQGRGSGPSRSLTRTERLEILDRPVRIRLPASGTVGVDPDGPYDNLPA